MSEFHDIANDDLSSLLTPDASIGGLREKMQVTDTIRIETLVICSLIERVFSVCDSADLLVERDTRGVDRSLLRDGVAVGHRACSLITEVEVFDLWGSGSIWIKLVEIAQEKGFGLEAVYASNRGHFPNPHDLNAVFVNRSMRSRDAAGRAGERAL